MKGSSSLFGGSKDVASANISFMPKTGEKARFARFIARRPDIDPNGMYDVIAHGNSDLIEITNRGEIITISPREAAKLIKRQEGFKKAKAIRLFSCSTGAKKDGFAQHLANALGKPVYAPNMTIHSNRWGSYWIEDNNKKGKFIKFIPGGNKDGK